MNQHDCALGGSNSKQKQSFLGGFQFQAKTKLLLLFFPSFSSFFSGVGVGGGNLLHESQENLESNVTVLNLLHK